MYKIKFVNMQSKKIILVGNSKSCKTSVCRLILNVNPPAGTTTPTVGVTVIPFSTVNENVCTIWDTAGDPKLAVLGDAFYMSADVCLIFEGGEEYRTPEQWEIIVRNVSPDIEFYHIQGTRLEKREQMLSVLAGI